MRSHMAEKALGISRFVWYVYDGCDSGTLAIPLLASTPCGSSQAAADQLTPGGKAYITLENWLLGSSLTQCEQYQNGLWACELQRTTGYDAWMLWSSLGTNISVPVPENLQLTVYRDWQNNLNTLPNQLTVSGMPVLLENHDL